MQLMAQGYKQQIPVQSNEKV